MYGEWAEEIDVQLMGTAELLALHRDAPRARRWLRHAVAVLVLLAGFALLVYMAGIS